MAHQLRLNKQQLQAVHPKQGTFLVVAGAGSGKTRIITARIAHLITQHGANPASIVALTFTNKAAKEMKSRVKSTIPIADPFIGTFHAYCLSILKKQRTLFAGRSFSILDTEDKIRLLKKLIRQVGLDKKISPKQAGHQISIIKNNCLDPTQHEVLQQNHLLAQLYALYEHERKASHSLDFDDLLLEALKLFNKSDFKKEFHDTVSHVLVDEYQDTNVVQHELLKQMTLQNKKRAVESLCAVGDEDQSIYSWRGATVANILNFKHDFAPATVITVEQNYRSVSPILEVAHGVIEHNKNRNPKKVWSERQANNRTKAVHCFSEYQEADAIICCIKALGPKKLKRSAILYRAHFQSRALEEALVKNSIPYKIIGGTQFYERKEIKDVVAYLRLVVNPFDRAAFFRVINCPAKGLGSKFEELFHTVWTQQPFMNFKEVGQAIIKQKKVTGVKKQSLEQFITCFKGLDYKSSAQEALSKIIERTAYLTHLKSTCDQADARARIENLQELIVAFEHFSVQGITTVSNVLDEISLLADAHHEQNKQQDPILLMTLHAAKGLEFDTVIIAGVQEGLLPNMRSLTDEEIEEERRLFYVGITRAQEHLLLTCSQHRSRYATTETHIPSRFLEEAPSHLIGLHDARYWKTDDFFVFFSDWLGTNYSYPASAVKTFGRHTKTQKTPVQDNSRWKVRQPVQHNQFGVGIVSKIDVKQDETVYLTIKFKSSTKKIDSRFVTKI